MDENKEQSVDQIDLGPFRHVIYYRDPRKDWEWVSIESDRYLPSEILYLYRGVEHRHVGYYKNLFAEWGVKFETFSRDDGVLIGYIKQTHRRWTILGELRSIVNYYLRHYKMPAKNEQEAMWETFEQTEAPEEP